MSRIAATLPSGAGGTPAIVRIPSSDVAWIKRVLDSGAEGLSCRKRSLRLRFKRLSRPAVTHLREIEDLGHGVRQTTAEFAATII